MSRADLLDLSRMLMARPSNWNETLPRLPDGSQALKAWYNAAAPSVAYQDGAASFTALCKHYLSCADNAALSATTALMGGLFVKLTTVGANRVLLCKGSTFATAATLEYSLAYIHSVTNFRFSVSNGSTVTSVTDTGTAPVVGVWYFLRFGLRSGTLYISRDAGAEITSAACPDIQDAAGAFSLGGCGDLTTYCNGAIDSAYISKTDDTSYRTLLLTPRRYADLTAANGLDVFQSNLVAWYDLSEATGSATWSDSNGTNHLTFTADPIISPTVLNGGFETRTANSGLTTGFGCATRARTSNVATITTAAAHGLVNNDVLTAITGFTDTTFNGTAKTVTRIDDTTFTYPSTGDDVGSAADAGARFATNVFANWTESVAGSSTISADTAAPYAGTYAARLDVDAASSNAYVAQIVQVIGKRYTATCVAKASSGTPGLGLGIPDVDAFTLTTDFVSRDVTYTAALTTFYVQRRSASASKSIYIDSVTLVSAELVSAAGIVQGPCVDTNPVAKLLSSAGFAGYDLTQTDMTKRPTFRTNQQNGHPCLVWTGSTQNLSNAADEFGTGDLTVYVAAKATGWGGGNAGRLWSNGKFALYVNSAGYLSATSDGVTIVNSGAASITLNTPFTAIVTRTSAGVLSFYVNGVLSGSAGQSSGIPAAGTPTYMGNNAAGTAGFAGNIFAAGPYACILSAAQIAALDARLSATWSI